jgi:carboxylesterase type B
VSICVEILGAPPINVSYFDSFRGCGTIADANVLSCLRSVSVDALTNGWNGLVANRTSTLYNFAPLLDGDFISTEPVEAFKSGQVAKVPVLFGYVPYIHRKNYYPDVCFVFSSS